LDKLDGFVSQNGRAFYKREAASADDGRNIVRLRRRKAAVTERYSLEGLEIVPFWAGKNLDWEIDS